MKVRLNYVSNSSSSSFVVLQDLSSKGINCLKLSKEQKELLNGFVPYLGESAIIFDLDREVYLTQYISDCSDKYDSVMEVVHCFYDEGQLNETPRCEDIFNEYQQEFGESIYLLKKHDIAKQMSLNQFVKEYKKTEMPKEFLVKYEDDGIKLIYIW